MRILVVSDLHLETCYNFAGIEQRIDKLKHADVVCLCGDVVSLNKHKANFYGYPVNPYIFRKFANKYRHVVYVRGNHEFWGATEDPLYEEHLALFEINNFHVLENDKITIEGQEFIGATMWYPETPQTVSRSRCFADFCYIKNHSSVVWKTNKETRQYFGKHVNENSIVLTHHLPSYRSVSDKYKDSDLNCFFVSDWAHEIIENNKPKFWFHGHTHDSFDYVLNETRIICNPYGYFDSPQENPHFNPGLIIEV